LRSPARSFPHPWPPDGTRTLRLEPRASHPTVTRDARRGGNRPPSTDLGYVTVITASRQRNHLKCATSCRTNEFIPLLDYDVEIRRVICSTNAIESLNARYRRAVRARGHFPSEQAALNCRCLVTRSLDPAGAGRTRWLNAFAITFGDRWPATENH
jgi:putative transposase